MPIPAFTIDGILPPFRSPLGPGAAAGEMSPFFANPMEVVASFAGTDHRRNIVRHWLQHRQELRSLGLADGVQWLDGSFVEDKNPNDLDIVTLLRRPAGMTGADFDNLVMANLRLFDRARVRAVFMLDSFFLDLDGDPWTLVGNVLYLGSLFSHRRGDYMWKGMLQVRLDDPLDAQAMTALA